MKIIAIEGLDKSGKHTQQQLLIDRLRSRGFTTEGMDFHQYHSPTGEIIWKYLNKQIELTDEAVELIMAADKQNTQTRFNEYEKQGVDFLILDRYIGSQYVYADSKGIDLNWIDSLLKHVRKPDIEILIDIPVEVSMARKGKHGDNDRYESDYKYLTNVRKAYLERYFFKYRIEWEAFVLNGEVAPEHLHFSIWNQVQNKLF